MAHGINVGLEIEEDEETEGSQDKDGQNCDLDYCAAPRMEI